MSHNHIPSMNKQWDNSETKHRQIERAQPDITCMSVSKPSSQCLYTNSERNFSKVITITFIAVWNLTMTTKNWKSHCSLMSQDSKINAETHSLLFGDQQKPKQMHLPHKKHTGRETKLLSGGGGEKIPRPRAYEAPFSLRRSRTDERGKEMKEAVGPMIHLK